MSPEVRGRAWWANEERKKRARVKAANAVRAGRIPAPAECEACGADIRANPTRARRYAKPPGILHHHDYAKPLDVIPLCWSCHTRIHAGSIPEPRTGRMYPVRAVGRLVEHEDLPELLTRVVADLVSGARPDHYDAMWLSMRGRAVNMGLVVRIGTSKPGRYERTELDIDAALARMRVPLAERAS